MTWIPRIHRVGRVLWAIFLISLPVTSFPFFPSGFGGDTLVRPLALYPLLILLVFVTLPRLFTQRLPRTIIPLLVFVVVALGGSVWAYGQGLEPLQGITVTARTMRSLATLVLGLAIYLTVILMSREQDDLQFTLRWLLLGMVIALFWGTLQIVYVLKFSPAYFQWMNKVQSYISIRKLFANRISGLTYEPNWFAELIVFLYFPWLFGAILTRHTIFRWRWGRVTVESLLIVWGIGVLVFTFSRSGLAFLVILILFSLLFHPERGKGNSNTRSVGRILMQRGLLALLAFMILAILFFVAGSQNRYFSRLWRYWTSDEGGELGYFQYIAFSQRFVYWQTAYNVFENHPLLGVGLGNYTFYFVDQMPDQPLYTTPELLRKLTPAQGRNPIVTPKNLFFRLLAETGLIGTGAFLTFLISLLGCDLFLFFGGGGEAKYWAWAGLLGMIAFLFMSFSFDSFAFPNMWVVFGMITAAAHARAATRSAHPGDLSGQDRSTIVG